VTGGGTGETAGPIWQINRVRKEKENPQTSKVLTTNENHASARIGIKNSIRDLRKGGRRDWEKGKNGGKILGAKGHIRGRLIFNKSPQKIKASVMGIRGGEIRRTGTG